MKIQTAAIALIKKDNKFLMTKRVRFDPEDKEFSPYVWQFPGGGMEFGETPEVRHNWQGIFICFLCKLKNENSTIILNDEASEYNWFELDEIPKLRLLPKTFEMAKESEKIKV